MIGDVDAGLFEVTDASLDYVRAAVDAARLSIANGDQRTQQQEAVAALLCSRDELARSLADLLDRLGATA